MNFWLGKNSICFYCRISDIFRRPKIIFALLDVLFSMAGMAMLESMLSPHLKNNGASDTDIGFFFLSVTVSYLFGNIVFGQVNKFRIYRRDNFKNIFLIMLNCVMCIFISLTLGI